MKTYAFVLVPLEAVYHRVFLYVSDRHSDEGDRQRLFHDDEVIVGDSESVHVRWIQQPPARHAGHDRCLIEHGQFSLLSGIV